MIEPLGFAARGVPAGDTKALTDAIEQADNLSLVLIETPANPTLVMTDIAQAAAAVRRGIRSARCSQSTTLCSARRFSIRSLHGADLVIYSATKFLGGFSDLLAGAVMAADPELIQTLTGMRALLGNILQADECWMLDSRLSTVALRMNRQSKNAQRIAEQLGEASADQARHLSVAVHRRRADKDSRRADRLSRLAAVAGGGGRQDRRVRISAPSEDRKERGQPRRRRNARMSSDDDDAQRIVAEEFARAGITESLVRISVGTEHWRDLLEEFTRALG